MVVRIIIDDLGIDQTPDARDLREHDVRVLHAIRDEIRQKLASASGSGLILRMPGDVFRRFSDLEGQPGLEVEHVSPRKLIRKCLGGLPPPPWLTAELADKLGLFRTNLPDPSGADDALERLLSLIAPELLSAGDRDGLAIALGQQQRSFSELLRIPDVAAWLRGRLADLGLADQVNAMLGLFGEDPSDGYRELARCVLRERLDRFILDHDLGTELALPPRNCPAALADAFGPLPLDVAQAGSFPASLLKLLDIAEREIRGGSMSVAALAELVLQDWSFFFGDYTSYRHNMTFPEHLEF